ncbi:MAG: hypothetical protein ACYC3N_10790 [Halothiobacillus sp.]
MRILKSLIGCIVAANLAIPAIAAEPESTSANGETSSIPADTSKIARAMEINRLAVLLRLSQKKLEQDTINSASADEIAADKEALAKNQSLFNAATGLK